MRKYLAEFLGTFILTFTACGATSFTGGYPGYLGVVGIALIFGLVMTALFCSIGSISGCHINPAVSLAMLISRRMNFINFMGYIVAQMLGGVAGSFAMYGISISLSTDTVEQYEAYGYDLLSFGTNGYGAQSEFLNIDVWGAFLVEMILTFIFVITVLSVTANKRYKNVAGIVIGMALSAVHLFGITLTGTGVNPARSFGPALAKAVQGDITPLSQVWLFIVAPIVGAILASIIYLILTYKKRSKKTKVSYEEFKEDKASDDNSVADISDNLENENVEVIELEEVKDE
jgi:aquaporin Z